MGRSGGKASAASVCYRRADDLSEVIPEWTAAGVDELDAAAPWRTFRWYRGQNITRSPTGRAPLAATSFMNADLSWRAYCLPALMPVCGTSSLSVFCSELRSTASHKHIPDYLLITDTGPVVVDVKPARRLGDPKAAFTFEWTREIVEARGWRYEVATEPVPVELENIRFLAEYRRDWLFPPQLLGQVRERILDGSPLEEAFNCLSGEPIHHVKSAVLQLLWRQELLIDLSKPLCGRRPLRRPV